MQDIRLAARALLKHPGFAVVAIVTIALGVGANAAIFSVVNGVLLRPLPYPESDRIVQVWSSSAAEPRSGHSPADFLDIQRRTRTLLHVAGYRDDVLTIAAAEGAPARVRGAQVTLDYFDVFGMPAQFGRTIGRTADGATSEPLIVLSHRMWVEQFASDAQIVSRRVRVNGVPHSVVGVMPPTFNYPEGARAWVLSPRLIVPTPPIDVPGDLLESRDRHYFQAIARMRPGVTLDQARADLATIVEDQARQYPQSNGGRGIAVQSLHEKIVGGVRRALVTLLAAVGVVLLIACANVASLQLAQGSVRHREMAIRAALGASRGRLIRHVITESLLLGAVGGAAGLLVGDWAIAILLRILPEGIPRAEQIALDGRVALAAILISLLTTVVFGLIPAVQGSRTDASLALRDADRTATAGRRRRRTRAVLVASEIALTIVLLVSAGLLINSFLRLRRVDPGFSIDRVTLASVPVPASRYPDGKRQAAFYQRLLEAVQQHHEIGSAAILFPNPIEGNSANGSFTIDGQPGPSRADRPHAALAAVSADYFRTLGIPLIAGRSFTERDRDPAPAVAIVNAALARRYFAGRDPIGRRIRFGDTDQDWITVVGIAADSRNVGLNEAPTPLVYLPYHAFPLAFMSIAVRSAGSAGTVASILRDEVARLDPDLAVDKIESLRELLHTSLAEPRFRTLLLGTFAGIALALAAVGVYGLMSFSVAQRTREIGIRLALGARPRQIILPILREGMQVAMIGVVAGVAVSLAASRVLEGFLFGVGGADALTYVAVVMLLISIALLATWIPSRTATRVDPISALRVE